jgi:hypothetical protein
MKSFIYCLLFVTVANAQVVRQADVQLIKNSKLNMPVLSSESLSKDLKDVLTENWKFSALGESIPLEEAEKKSKQEENNLYIVVESITRKSLTHGSGAGAYRNVTTGMQIAIKHKKDVLAQSYIPAFGGTITKEILHFGISNIQYMLKTMDEKQMKNNLGLKPAYKEKTKDLKDRELLVPDGWVKEGFTEPEIRKLYTGNMKLVDYETWSQSILSKASGKAYAIVVPIPMGDSFVYQHYLMDAETGTVYAICQPKVAMNVGGINVSKANTGYINDKNVKLYAGALQGDW